MHDLSTTLRLILLQLRQGGFRWSRRVLSFAGAVLLVMAVLACTRVPFEVHRWLGAAAGECGAPQDVIVVLGGSGMPSGPELLRLHRGARLAVEWPGANVVLIHPDTADAMQQMVAEMLLRGVEQQRITLIAEGDNTRAQALAFAAVVPPRTTSIALVTAPENMYRSVRTFRRAGFEDACGVPAWDHAMHHDFAYAHRAIGGKQWVPDVSQDPGLRYTFWNYLKLEITCLREFVALAYYWLNDWV